MMTIGELSSASGVSIRALRHYDEIGLLIPARRSDGNYRLYDQAGIERLHQIRALKSLGLSLEEIGRVLIDGGPSLPDMLQRQLDATDARIEELHRLRQRITGLLRNLEQRQHTSTNELLELIREMRIMEKYYTEDQLAALEQRAADLGEAGIRAAEEQWADLIERVRQARATGIDPSDPEVRKMAEEWQGLIDSFTGGDAGIRQSLDQVWQQEEEVAGFDASEMGELITWLHLKSGDSHR